MALQETTGWCDVCKTRRKLERDGPNHILHLLLTIFTAGIWLIIWILAGIRRRPWLCSTCGSDYVFPGEDWVKKGLEYYREKGGDAAGGTFCTRCGTSRTAAAAFCSTCGAAQDT